MMGLRFHFKLRVTPNTLTFLLTVQIKKKIAFFSVVYKYARFLFFLICYLQFISPTGKIKHNDPVLFFFFLESVMLWRPS